MPQAIAMKADLRTRLSAMRNGMTRENRQRASDAITLKILALDTYRAARTVMAYMTFGSEFLTDRFIRNTLDESKVLVLPRLDRVGNELQLYAVGDLDTELTAGPWGIREPQPDVCPPVAIADVDLVLVPGVGFTARGDRLGYGRGYYDRVLAHRDPRTALVAAAFAIQVVDAIPVAGYDVPIDMIITEAETYCCRLVGSSE